ncbi:hypothetical protein FACS1894208_07740 [Clostridia bacterium]|nr:hypothetical protein FACS1894208_07740 [Clostridia bacterium]
MAFVSVPKDLSKVKTKIAMNLTKRQLICFSTAAVVGIPAYIFTRGTIGNSAAALLMIGIMLPFFFLAMYEKDGQPAEKLLRNYIRARFWCPGKRPYKTENFYEIITKGVRTVANKTTANSAKTPVRKRKTGKKQ